MEGRLDKDQDILIVQRGEEVIGTLNSYAKKKHLPGAWLQGLGGAGKVIIGYYDLDTKQYVWKQLRPSLEILSLTGNLAWHEDMPVWHIHGVFSDHNFNVLGGHVKELHIELTSELFVTPLEHKLVRKSDQETGLNLLRPYL